MTFTTPLDSQAKTNGGSRLRLLSGTSAQATNAFYLQAEGSGNAVIGSLEINGVASPEFNNAELVSGQAILFGDTQLVTSITLSSGKVFVNEV